MMKNSMTFILLIMLLMVYIPGESVGRQIKSGDRSTEAPLRWTKAQPKITRHNSSFLLTGWYYVVASGKGLKRQLEKSNGRYFIDRNPILTPRNFSVLSIDGSTLSGGRYSYRLTMQLDREGHKLWAIATEKSIGKQLAFILDNRLLYVAEVLNPILSGVTVIDRGNDSRQEMEKLKAIIESER
jgi:hypothetical protein